MWQPLFVYSDVLFTSCNMRSRSITFVGGLLGVSIVFSKPTCALTGRADSTSSSLLSIDVPATYDSTDTIDPNFPAFGFEEASFVNYILDVDGNTNEFSTNLIAAVTNRTGGTP